MKGLGNAIDNDDKCSSTWLRIEDFQRHDLHGRHRFGRARDGSFSDLGSPGSGRRSPASVQAAQHQNLLSTLLAAAGVPYIVEKSKARHTAGDKTFKIRNWKVHFEVKDDWFAGCAVASSVPRPVNLRAAPLKPHLATFKDFPQRQAAAGVDVRTMTKRVIEVATKIRASD